MSAARAASRLSATRRPSARPGSIARSQPVAAARPAPGLAIRGRPRVARLAAPRPLIAAAVRSASSALRSWSRTISAPSATASAAAAAVAHSRSAAGARPSQEPASTAPRKSFRDRATNRGRPSSRSSPRRRRISRSSSTERSKSRPGIERDLLLGHAMLERRLDPLPEPALQVGDRIPVAGRLAIGARRALDVHEHVAAAPFGHQVEHPGVGATGDVVDRRGAGVERSARDLGLKGVGGHRHARARGPAPRRRGRAARPPRPPRPLPRCGPPPRPRREGRTPPRPAPSRRSTARSGVSLRAPSKNESAVTLTIPTASGGGNSSRRSARRQRVIRGLT